MTNLTKGLLSLAAVASALSFTACSDESPWHGSEGEGSIVLNFSTDSRVMRQTRADDNQSAVVPAASEFSVSLSKSDGSYAKNWNTLEAFQGEKSFPMGDYTLKAYYGDPEKEGFGNAYFEGAADVHVSPGTTNNVTVVATLANAMVSVRYTDEFISNFPAYSAAIQSEGHDWVVFAQDEPRPAYVAPSDVKLNLTLTNYSGEQVTIQPAEFTARPRHHYIVTVGVTGNSATGNLALDVQFDEDVVCETVNVSLGDELFSAPAPEIKAKGFTADTTLESFEYADQANKTEFHALAFGGLKSAVLTVVSPSGYNPTFGRSVELINASSLTQQQLAEAGIEASGFFRNVDKMGVVDVTKFISSLPAGTYNIELQVVDAMTRTAEPVKLPVTLKPVEFELGEPIEAEFMTSELTVDVVTNCPDIKDKVKFQAPDANDRMVEVPVTSVTQVQASAAAKTRSTGNITLRFKLAIAPRPNANIDVIATLGAKTRSMKVPMADPVYEVVTDAFAHQLMVKLNGINDAQTAWIRDNVRFMNGETEIPQVNISHDSEGVITISGLAAGTRYESLKCVCGAATKAIPAFSTEQDADVPNGDFSSVTETLRLTNIQVGGKYKVGAFDYYNRVTVSASEPIGWASLNKLTCSDQTNPMNTWFAVPSTFTQDGAVVLRSVGYNHSGSVPAKSGSFFSTSYYCANAPADANLDKSAGELFLGSYNTSKSEGVAFNSRPSALSFRYKYVPYNGEKGEAVIRVLDKDGNLLAGAVRELSASNDMQTVTMSLKGYKFGSKAAKLEVAFRSTKSGVTPKVNIPSGSALKEPGVSLNTDYYYTLPENTYNALATGSVLTIDDVTLSYSGAPGKAAKPARR
ncbi:MAG: DUF4493 domain-containing protein [Muribaculaceae bacterium]|nr:DUF4493 domain-containing protein [Muribaculaceae bacterium]